MVGSFDPKNLSSLLGGGNPGANNAAGGLDPRKILDTLMKNPMAGGAVGGLAGSLLAGMLTGKGGGKKLAKTAVKAGGLALVGTVAWKAWQHYQATQQGRPAPPVGAAVPALPAAFDLESPAALQSGASLRVIQAMITAAKADGIVDPIERQKIAERIDSAALEPAERHYVDQLLDRPMDVESLVQGIDSGELAAEVYTASALAVHPASRVEKGYLDLLAARLGIEPSLASEIDRGVVAALDTPAPVR